MQTDAMPTELRLAAIITLLSSSALRGVSPGKTAALRAHLDAVAFSRDSLSPHLRSALEDALVEWINIEYSPEFVSVDFCTLAVSGQVHH